MNSLMHVIQGQYEHILEIKDLLKIIIQYFTPKFYKWLKKIKNKKILFIYLIKNKIIILYYNLIFKYIINKILFF